MKYKLVEVYNREHIVDMSREVADGWELYGFPFSREYGIFKAMIKKT